MTSQKVKLGDVLTRVKNLVPIKDSEDYKLVTVKLFHKGVTLRKIVKGKELSASKMHSVRAGEFILSGIDARHGAFGIIPQELDGAVVSNDFWCLDFDETKINKKLFLKLTSTTFFDDLCKKASDGTTNRVRLQADRFFNLEIDLPPVEKQEELIENFQTFEDHGTEIKTEISDQLELVRQLRQAFLREAMQGKLVSQDDADEPAEILLKKIKAEKAKLIAEKKIKKEKALPEIKPEETPFEIPNNWTWCRLQDICIYIIDCPHSTPKYVEKNTGFYGIDTNCINDRGEIIRLRSLSEESYTERIRRLKPVEKDIIYAREGSIGRATFIPADKNICLGQRVMLFRPFAEIFPEFLKFCVTEEQYKNRLLEKHRGMGAKHVNVKDIVLSHIALPPLAEQKRIVEKLEKLMAFCDELEANIRKSKHHAETLLQVALKEALEPQS